jgi:hypothetical protein
MSIPEMSKVEFEFSVNLNGPHAVPEPIKGHLNEIYNWYEFIAMYHEMNVKIAYVEKKDRFTGVYKFEKKDAAKIIPNLRKYVHADNFGIYPIIIDDTPYIIVGILLSVTEDL